MCLNLPPRRGRGECRVHDAPVAARGVVVNTRVSPHGYPGSPGIPARNGFNGFLRALLGDRACLSPSPARRVRPVRADTTIRKLDASVEASGPHDFAVRKPARSSVAPPASIASHPASVTIAIRPSDRDGIARILVLIWGRDQQRRLRQIGTTGKSAFWMWPSKGANGCWRRRQRSSPSW